MTPGNDYTRPDTGSSKQGPRITPPLPGPNLAPRDGELAYFPGFLGAAEAAEILERLRTSLNWREESLRIAGKSLRAPRLVCWYGDPEAIYRYSGVSHHPLPWTSELQALRRAVEAASGHPFNSVLGNLYRSGQDSMGWHADREKSLGEAPFIASLSLGATRLFKLRHQRSGETIDLELAGGSLLLMGGKLQHHWRHCLPKTKAPASLRINLTFRRVLIPELSEGAAHG